MFVDYNHLYDQVISFLIKNTKKPKINSFSTNLGVSINKLDDYDVSSRKIITKLMMNSNIIAADGRYGPAKSVIVGKNNFHYFHYIEEVQNFNNFDFIYDTSIDPDQVIMCRPNNIANNGPGILLIDNSDYGRYYLHGIDRWESQFSWFTIK
jgi:hypothetical protein